MKKNMYISEAVIKRLPRYRRTLEDLLKKNVEVISSNKLSVLTGFTASQIRQDLNNFGAFGLTGYGYNVNHLFQNINVILGLDREYKMIIVGAGHLGQAIANFTHFLKSGFNIVAMFEVNPRLIGLRINDIEVLDFEKLAEYLKKNQIDIGIITTSKESAQVAADELVAGGVKGIWNFATADLSIPVDLPIDNVHLSDSLHSLTYFININNQANLRVVNY